MSSYTAKNIEILEGLEPVRKRPGMYIAGTDTTAGLHQLVFEILDNSVDEAINGYAKKVEVTLSDDRKSVTIEDDGRGIPVDIHPKFKKPALELILTTLHAGGKFSDKNYQTSGGLHGVGTSVVNALSSSLVAEIKRDGKLYVQEFAAGKAVSKLKSKNQKVKGSGTKITLQADPSIFKSVIFDPNIIRETCRTKAYLNAGVSFSFTYEGKCEKFFFEEGIKAYLANVLEEKKLLPVGEAVFDIVKDEGIRVEMAFCWTESTRETWKSYANGIHTGDGGSHEQGAKAGIVRGTKNYLQVHDLIPKGLKIGAEDIREGLVAVLSVFLNSSDHKVQFQGQTKDKLNNPEASIEVENVVKSVEQLLNERPQVAETISKRIVLAAKARAASRAASQSVRRKVGISHRLTLPGKLADCSSKRSDESELFIVEGDSAGGSAKQGRKREFQAVLPLRGKVLNAISSPTKKVLENKELGNVISALGCGAGADLNLDKLRYSKVIILTDADADGMHIATLLLAFFYKHMQPLIESGSLYIGKPPLYGVFQGKKTFWVYSDEELELTIAKNKLKEPRIVRYKGLGEMNPDTLWETTLNPESRTLLRVNFDEEDEIDIGLKALLGSDSSERARLIKENAHRIGSELDL